MDQDSGRGTGRSCAATRARTGPRHRLDVDRPPSGVANPLPRRMAQGHIEPQLRTPGGAGTGTARSPSRSRRTTTARRAAPSRTTPRRHRRGERRRRGESRRPPSSTRAPAAAVARRTAAALTLTASAAPPGRPGQACGAEVGPQVAAGLGQRVAAELLQRRVGQHQRDHRLGHDTRGGHRADVGALVDRLAASPVATSTVRSARGTVEIGFIATRTRTRLAVGHAALDAARAVGEPRDRVAAAIISSCAALPRRRRCGTRRRSRRPSSPGCPSARPPAGRRASGRTARSEPRPDRQAVRDHLDDAAERVAVGLRGVDLGDHRGGDLVA